jgi:Cu/Ag efflux protein CusF/peroxiredoxin
VSTRNLIPIALLLAAGICPVAARAPVPRESPELKLRDGSDHEVLLSNFKGRVVLMEFLLTNCQHCSRVAQTINSLYRDLGPRGFQPLGIAFENNMSGPLVARFAQDAKLAYPVGFTSADNVDAYLGRRGNERFGVPQIVVIDRRGVVRAQSQAVGEPVLENEAYLRKLIGTLLEEGAPSWTPSISSISSVAALVILGCIFAWRRKQKGQMRSLAHSSQSVRVLPAAVALALAGLVAGTASAQETAKKTYTLHGRVEKVDRKTAKLTVNGEQVEGWMPAMTMAYRVDNPDVLKSIKPGDQVEATVYERDMTLYHVTVVPKK